MSSAFTLADLLSRSDLDLRLLTTGIDPSKIEIMGAHSVEVDDPAAWVDPHWMMLTTGLRVRNKPQSQRQLIAELDRLGASALGVGLGLAFKHVPPAMIEEAEARRFPLVLVPQTTAFREVIREVFKSAASIDAASFQRLMSMQQNMLRAFSDEHPLRGVLHRLSRLTNASVALLDSACTTTAATGPLPVPELMAPVDRSSRLVTMSQIGGWNAIVAPLGHSRKGPTGWVVVASEFHTLKDEVAKAALQVAIPLIQALSALDRIGAHQDRATRGALLEQLLDREQSEAATRTAISQAERLAVPVTDGVRILRAPLHAEGDDGEVTTELDDVIDEIESWGPCLISLRPDAIVALIPADRRMGGDIASSLTQRGIARSVGVGRVAVTAAGIHDSFRDSELCVNQLRQTQDADVLFYDEMNLAQQTLAEVDPARIAAKSGELVALLLANPIQFEALRAYFANGRDVRRAADSIFVHPNTLRYRLERFENAADMDLSEPSVIASIYLLLSSLPDEALPTDSAE